MVCSERYEHPEAMSPQFKYSFKEHDKLSGLRDLYLCSLFFHYKQHSLSKILILSFTQIEPGDSIVLWARAMFPGWENRVYFAQIEAWCRDDLSGAMYSTA